MVKKLLVALVAIFFSVILTLFFYLSSATLVDSVNGFLPHLVIKHTDGYGNILWGYRFDRLSVMKGSDELLSVSELKINFRFFPLLWGAVGLDINSQELSGRLNLSLFGKPEGEVNIKEINFDTTSFGINENVQFSSKLSGVLKISKGEVLLEIKTDEISWKKLTVNGIDLPFTLFSSARGGILFSNNRVLIKSLNFEGVKGNARIVGEVVNGKPSLELEIIPKDWNEPYLIPLEQYKAGPGFYKLSLSL